MSAEGAELLKAVKQMKAKKKGKVYTPEQLLAIAARQSVNLTQKEFAQLLNVSIDSVQDWEQGRRSPRGAAKTLLRVAKQHPEVLEQIAS
ncbi:MAG: type II toxin-antitoxin system MqsA family antitoxin [Paracoccaceae bacterium]|jgi:putative transcriptional regulator|nr:type II toxin-antitoxin system MqsA family antitoxin [Paracoccaceae bacterium]